MSHDVYDPMAHFLFRPLVLPDGPALTEKEKRAVRRRRLKEHRERPDLLAEHLRARRQITIKEVED